MKGGDTERPALTGSYGETGRWSELMEIGIAADEYGIVASLRIDDARQRRIGKAKIGQRRIGEIEKRQGQPTMLSSSGDQVFSR